MATVIDALVVTLGLDPRKFTEGQKTALEAFKRTQDQSTRTAKEMEARGKQAAQFFTKIRNEVIALGAAILGAAGLEQFIQKMTTADAATGRLAKNLNVSVRDLTTWQHAAERVGGSAAATGGSIKGLVTEFQRMQLTGQSEILGPLALAGVDMAKFIDQATPMTEKLLMLSDAFKKLPRQRALFLGAQMGLDEGTMNVMLDDTRKLLNLERQHGVMTEKDAAAAIKLANAWHDLSRTFTDAGEKMLTALTPALSELMDQLSAYVDAHKGEIIQWAKDLAEWIKNIDWASVRQGISDFVTGANKAAEAVGGWTRVAEILLGLWVGSKFLGVLANVTALGAAGAGSLGILTKLAAAAGVGFVVHEAVKGVDPDDKFGMWMDRNVPGASWLDDKASKLGLGRSYGQQQAAEDMAFFQRKGWSRDHAAALAATVSWESGGNPNARGDGGKALGLAQWHPDRQRDLMTFALQRHMNYLDRHTQLEFMNYELTEGKEREAGRQLGMTGSAAQGAILLNKKYERSADTPELIAGRAALAASFAGVDPTAANNMALVQGSSESGVSRGHGFGQHFSNSSNDVSISNVTINTQATDADAMAREVSPAFKKYFFVPQANYGLQ